MPTKKTYIYLGLIIALIIAIMGDPVRRHFFKKFHPISEDSEMMYSGKIKEAFNPLDQAYVISDELKNKIKEEDPQKYNEYKIWPVISIWIKDADLNDPSRGVIQNGMKQGRLWERASYTFYYEPNAPVFESYTGFRLHGGASRNLRVKTKSFRIYFRKEYGKEKLESAQLMTQKSGTPAKRIVIRHDKSIHFAHDFLFSLQKRMGGMTPNISPVAFYLNGEFYGHHFMTEHLDEQQLELNFKGEDYAFYKKKSDNPTIAYLLYNKLISQISLAAKPISLSYVKSLVDIENFTAHMIVLLYTGMTDWDQGMMIKKISTEQTKWRWIGWDYDNAFSHDFERVKTKRNIEHPWEIESFYTALNLHQDSARGMLFKRLLNESPEYVGYFLGRLDVFFKEALSQDFIQSKLEFYESLAEDAKYPTKMVNDIEKIRLFIRNRNAVLCAHTLEVIEKLPSYCQN